jgi:predicted membrane protein
MFKPKTIKAVSILAMILCIVGILISIIMVKESNGSFFLGILSWLILLYASIVGFQLSSYKLYEEEYKKIGIRIYLIIVLFILFFFVGLIIGLGLAVILLSALWGLKHNYDDWVDIQPIEEPNSIKANDTEQQTN